MSDKEMNIAILEELKQIANEVFTNEINIVPGTYTAAELAKGKSSKGDILEINYIKTNNESILTRSVCVGLFKCEFERKNIFNLIWKFEQLTGTKQKNKAHFVKVEAGKVDLSFSVEITKEMQLLCKCVGNDVERPVMSYVSIDYKNGYLVASNGFHLQACKANISDIEGETETSVLIDPKDLKQLSGVCSVTVCDGKVTISDETGRAYLLECSALKYPRWTSVAPKVSEKNYFKINEVKEVLSFLKKKKGTFYMYAEKGHKVTIDYINSDSGTSSQIEVFTANEIPFAFSVMFDVKSFQVISQKWDGGIFLNANYKAVVLTDKDESICFTMPSGTGKEGFYKMDFDFDRSNMVSLLDYRKEEKPQTAIGQKQEPKKNIPTPIKNEPENLPIPASVYNYNILGSYVFVLLLCELYRGIIYHEAKEVSKRLKMLFSSQVVNVEDFANELQIIDLQPDEAVEIIEPEPSPNVVIGKMSQVATSSGDLPFVFTDTLPSMLCIVVRLLVASMLRSMPTFSPVSRGGSRLQTIHIRDGTERTTKKREQALNFNPTY